MTGKYFLDTNIIIYAADADDVIRRRISQQLISNQNPVPVISTQVMQESYYNLNRKLGLSAVDCIDWMIRLNQFDVCQLTPALIFEGIAITQESSISFWDSLIVAAAAHSGCEIIYTEDLNHGQSIRGVKIVNPFNVEGIKS